MVVVGWGQSVYLLVEFEFTSSGDAVSARKFIIAVTTHKLPGVGHCESSANRRCRLSVGAGEESDGEGGGGNTERNAHTYIQIQEEMRWQQAHT